MIQPPHRERVVGECVTLIDEEVKSKSGLSGIAIKGAYAVVKAVKPKFVTEVVDSMLDDWVKKLQPYYDDWQKAGSSPALPEYLAGRSDEVSESLLQVTDEKAKTAKNNAVKKMYEKMRPSARKQVGEALPRLGR